MEESAAAKATRVLWHLQDVHNLQQHKSGEPEPIAPDA